MNQTSVLILWIIDWVMQCKMVDWLIAIAVGNSRIEILLGHPSFFRFAFLRVESCAQYVCNSGYQANLS